jgi:hypothetical protein
MQGAFPLHFGSGDRAGPALPSGVLFRAGARHRRRDIGQESTGRGIDHTVDAEVLQRLAQLYFTPLHFGDGPALS